MPIKLVINCCISNFIKAKHFSFIILYIHTNWKIFNSVPSYKREHNRSTIRYCLPYKDTPVAFQNRHPIKLDITLLVHFIIDKWCDNKSVDSSLPKSTIKPLLFLSQQPSKQPHRNCHLLTVKHSTSVR